MKNLAVISLEGLEFFAYHGFYAEEQKIGNKYSVDVSIFADLSDFQEDNLDQTINYELVYRLVETVMQEPTKLLEDIALKISHAILSTFVLCQKVRVNVAKHNPPIGGICQQAKVSILLER